MTVTLEAMLRRASKETEKMFKKCGYIEMCWIVDTEADGMVGVMAMPVDSGASKDALAANMREMFKRMGATRYVMVCEAWTLKQGYTTREDLISAVEDVGGTISNMPRRVEVIWLHEGDGRESLFAMRGNHPPSKGQALSRRARAGSQPPSGGPLHEHAASSERNITLRRSINDE